MPSLERHLHRARALAAIAAMAVVVAVANMAGPARAGPLSWFSKTGPKAPAHAAGDAAANLASARAIALTMGLGAGAVLIDFRGGRLFVESLQAGSKLEGSIDDLSGLARDAVGSGARTFVISSDGAAALGARLDALLDAGPVHVIEPSLNTALPLVRRQAGGHQPTHFKLLRPNILVPLDARIGIEFARMLDDPVRREKLRVASMFASSDVDSIHKLSLAAGSALEDTQRLMQGARSGRLEMLRGTTVILVGHIEGGAFTLKNAGGSIERFDIQALEQLARKWDFQLISAGCESFCAGARAGFADRVTSTQMADAVRRSFEAHTLADLLQAFAHDRPLVITQEAMDRFASSESLHASELAKGTRIVNTGALGVRVYSLASKPRNEVLAGIGGWYMIGVIAFAAMFKSHRAAFLRVFPKLPSGALAETRNRHLLQGTGRELLFVLLGPVFAAVCVLTFLIGGWGHRETVAWRLWRVVRHPVSGSADLVRIVSAWLTLVLAYCAALALIALPPFYLIRFGLGESGGGWATPSLVLAGIYVLFACWAAWHAHKAVGRRLR